MGVDKFEREVQWRIAGLFDYLHRIIIAAPVIVACQQQQITTGIYSRLKITRRGWMR